MTNEDLHLQGGCSGPDQHDREKPGGRLLASPAVRVPAGAPEDVLGEREDAARFENRVGRGSPSTGFEASAF